MAYCGDSLELTKVLPSDCFNLIMTSPPFALRRKKAYGGVNADEYVEWFIPFARQLYRVLKPDGSCVIHIGGSWAKGKPVKSLYLFELLLRLCNDIGFYLAQDIYWFNKAKLPSPAQWVTVNKWRLKDAVDCLWWFSKTEYPKADSTKVLVKYSKSMKRLLKNRNYYKPNVRRPSEHTISDKFYEGHGGAIPPNFFDFSNTSSNTKYLRLCRKHRMKPHPARYPIALPTFFIRFLTDKGDLVFDPFGGSNVTGKAAERLKRRWITFEIMPEYLEASRFRFNSQSKGAQEEKRK